MKKKATFHRLLGYMWRYRIVSSMALTFILLTTLVTTALPLLARYFIDQFIGRNQAFAGSLLWPFPLAGTFYLLGKVFLCACGSKCGSGFATGKFCQYPAPANGLF